MKYPPLAIVCGTALLLCLVLPAAGAVTPLWIQPATTGGDLSGVVISDDGKTIIAGGSQLIALTTDGRKRWSGWSGTCLDISSDGDFILSSQNQVIRLISGTGTLLWDQSFDAPITDVSMTRNASTIAAVGGNKVRTIKSTGEGIASNSTMLVNHLRILPESNRILITSNKNVQLSNYTLISEWSDTNSSQDLIGVAADGSSFVTATNNRIRMYNRSGGLLWDRKFPGGNARALAYSRDGSTVVIGKDDNNVQVLNRSGAQLWTANATGGISSVAVSSDGNTIVAGSLDKKVSVYNHAGIRLGTFSARSAIRANSVAVTGDGSLIVVVDNSAVYGLPRSSFIEQQTTTGETISTTLPETTAETTTSVPVPTTRKVTIRVPTPYPSESETPETPLPPAVPLVALLMYLACLRKS